MYKRAQKHDAIAHENERIAQLAKQAKNPEDLSSKVKKPSLLDK